MKKLLLTICCLLLCVAINAQKGKILSVEVLGVDKYPSRSFLDVLVNVEYEYVSEEAVLILYVDNTPLNKVESLGKAYGQLYKRSAASTALEGNKPKQTAKYRLKLWLDPTRLKGGESTTYYVGCFIKDVSYSQGSFGKDRHDRLRDIIVPIEYDSSLGKVNVYRNELPKWEPAEGETKRLERIAEQTRQETASLIGGFLGAMGAVAVSDACRECDGSGCEYCNYTGRSNKTQEVLHRGVREGYNMTAGNKRTTAKTEGVIRDGYHTKIYSNGKYTGYFKNGKRNGKGTYTYTDGSKYVGEWEDGMFNGKGTLTTPTKYKYVGEFSKQQMDGKGTLTLPDGSYYVGDFWADRIYGEGTYYMPADKKYMTGFFRENKLESLYKEGPYNPSKSSTPSKK